MGSTSSASQRTALAECLAPSRTCTRPRYAARPPPRATDLEMMELLVFGAMCTILEPVSWCWPSPANAMDRVSPLACSPTRYTAGYFMVTLEPMLPSTHSMVAPSSQMARLVTRLYTLLDQFWMVVYRTRAPFFTMISTTAECSESLE